MKTILITGASRGIGLATAKRFLGEGWYVIGTYNKTKMPIEDANLDAVQYDQSSPESIKEVTEYIKNKYPKIDVLVNNAGIILDAHDTGLEMEKLRKTFEVDLFGLVDFTENLLPILGKGSHIISVDSLYGSFSWPIDGKDSSAYRMTKAALNMYTRTLAYRLEEKGIIVSSLDPGWVKTDMGNSVADEDYGHDRTPEEPADDIFELVTNVTESGYFWQKGVKREW